MRSFNTFDLVEVLQQGDLLLHKEISAGVHSIIEGPEGADVHARRLGHINEWRHAPKQSPVHPHQVLCGQTVGLVQDETDLGFAALHLPEEHLQFPPHIKLGGIEHQEDQVGSVDEPLAHLVVWIPYGGKVKPRLKSLLGSVLIINCK